MKNQVPKVSFKIAAGDLMLVFSHEFADIIFCKYSDILEIISGCRSDPFTLIYLELPTNFYMIACTNIQNFEERENCASTISGEQTLGYDTNFIGSDMILFRSDLILFFSGFKFQDLLVMLVAALINFGVKNQAPRVSFEIVAGDLMSVFFYEFADIIFYVSLDILEII